MRITVVTVGKIKEKFFTMAIDEYAKRLSRYCKLEIVEVQDEKTPDEASAVEELQIKQKEGERISKYIKDGAYVISLAIEGKKFSSTQLASEIERITTAGKSHLIFIIGGSLGLDPKILRDSDLLLSFSDMTFPHQLMRVVLLEQIYRCFRINSGEPYHK